MHSLPTPASARRGIGQPIGFPVEPVPFRAAPARVRGYVAAARLERPPRYRRRVIRSAGHAGELIEVTGLAISGQSAITVVLAVDASLSIAAVSELADIAATLEMALEVAVVGQSTITVLLRYEKSYPPGPAGFASASLEPPAGQAYGGDVPPGSGGLAERTPGAGSGDADGMPPAGEGRDGKVPPAGG